MFKVHRPGAEREIELLGAKFRFEVPDPEDIRQIRRKATSAKGRFNESRFTRDILTRYLRGWSDVVDEDGNAVPYEEGVWKLLPEPAQARLALEVCGFGDVDRASEGDEGN